VEEAGAEAGTQACTGACTEAGAEAGAMRRRGRQVRRQGREQARIRHSQSFFLSKNLSVSERSMEEESVVPGVAVPGAAVDFVPSVLAAIESQGAAATGTVTAIMPMDEATARPCVTHVTRSDATAAQRARSTDDQMDGDATTGARVEPTCPRSCPWFIA
jgi:hypothetical protein